MRLARQVQMLHDSLQLSSGGLSRAKVVGRQISHEVRQLQKRMAEQERVLGALAMELGDSMGFYGILGNTT